MGPRAVAVFDVSWRTGQFHKPAREQQAETPEAKRRDTRFWCSAAWAVSHGCHGAKTNW